jgi:hypothetical protein
MPRFTLYLCALLVFSGIPVVAGTIATTRFAHSPTPEPGELLTPRAVVGDPRDGRLFVLDAGLRRIVAFASHGGPLGAWPLPEADPPVAIPADPLLPIPALGYADHTLSVLWLNRVAKQVTVLPIDSPLAPRIVALPEGAVNGAVALDATGRVLVAYMRITGGAAELLIARETATGAFITASLLPDPCAGQAKNLHLTGFACEAGGQLAIGIAQTGDAPYSFIRSWLIQGTLADGVGRTTALALLDGRGKVQERYRAPVELAGRAGFPEKPCVPLFTALALGEGGRVVSGGHTLDPFVRVVVQGRVVVSWPHLANGGQHAALWATAQRPLCLALADPATGWVTLWTLTGLQIGLIGHPLPYHLAQPLALAASPHNVFVASRLRERMTLTCFSAPEEMRWSRTIAPPRGLEKAVPVLCASPSRDRVFLGWRLPGAAGVSWVEMHLDDSTPGMPLWDAPLLAVSAKASTNCPTPLVCGDNGRLYVLRETPAGPRVLAFSPTGTLLQQFPPELQGVSLVMDSGELVWARPDEAGIALVRYTPQGHEKAWKRLPLATPTAQFMPARTVAGYAGWLSTSKVWCRLDATLAAIAHDTLEAPTGELIGTVVAVAGDGAGEVYLAVPGCILRLAPEATPDG